LFFGISIHKFVTFIRTVAIYLVENGTFSKNGQQRVPPQKKKLNGVVLPECDGVDDTLDWKNIS
jgi:hypothetical protein